MRGVSDDVMVLRCHDGRVFFASEVQDCDRSVLVRYVVLILERRFLNFGFGVGGYFWRVVSFQKARMD